MNNKGETYSVTRLAIKTGTRHSSTVLGSVTTGKQDSTQTWTSTVLPSARGLKSYRHVHPKCKSKNSDNSALFMLTDQFITTSQNKWKEG